jgi:hypothetical protein
MTVQSKPMVDGKPVAQHRGIHWDRLPIVLLGVVILGLWWAAGAKYTIDGLPLLLNEIGAFFRIPLQLGQITDWRWYVLMSWLPVMISIAERRYAPWRRLTLSSIMIWVIGVWLIVSAIDAGSTWLAVIHPPADSYTLTKQIAAIRPLAAAWSIVTTFAPEVGMGALLWWLRGR